ncbi:DUF480 domain-containing protein [Silvibacterium dinghuense]|uniref:DUF480 domain-containing protein n=2 Tax=Silvibacterium dinghuense TaxID=1560006 RepID=A0A4Q1SFY3_9BACT|nr:YceH family protein [Silvibacterium dinghuense]RXS95748.1 DUF480 domain-containing protein [Silvibacterium dinghuense]GGH12313.1 UPF0502 protein [Silvibacterium dinghuense]
MAILLEPNELRVLGSLIEKEITTPEYYPLSLNALLNACNQKSSRDPVMQLDEIAVERALSRLEELSLVRRAHDARVTKYEHQARNLLDLKRPEIAVLCLLLLRGPQTPGELRSRADRLYTFDDIGAVTSTLERMGRQPSEEDSIQRREHAPLVTLLPRQPGEKEARYAHTLAGTPAFPLREPAAAPATHTTAAPDRIAALEAEVANLHTELRETRERLARLETLFGIEADAKETGGNPE